MCVRRNVRLLADIGDRRVDLTLVEVGAHQPLENTVESRGPGRCHCEDRGPRHRVFRQTEPDRDRQE